ncbi:hypothetical protein BVG16_10625 [Paenibacillus selenitireducens]|uniref:Uncharacterized protein n=1 Tax=Paenibacillus selenitireducens TaxID=1324314 RepID=A0A1T2XEN0_9BACL|nr:Ger(x)C family spore germination protein [Paenibacillus selenitireducens]OPA78334.1 hypothetical protein BVG16_10625 [Paenibacillus selenitireducens]
MKGLRFISVFVILLLLSGCLKTNVLERLSILVAIGYDAKEDNTFKVTAALMESQPDVKDMNRTVSVDAATSKGARRKMNEMLPHEIANGQLRVILLDRNIFRLKMLNEVDVLSRDPAFGDMVMVAIVDGSVQDLLTYPYKNKSNIGVTVNSLLDHNMKWNWGPLMTLHEFTHSRDIHTKELAIPMMKREGEEIALKGVALLHGDHIVGEATPREGYFLKTMKGEKTSFLYETVIKKSAMQASGMAQFLAMNDGKDEVKVVFHVIQSKGTIKLLDSQNIKFDVNLHIDMDIQEISERYSFEKTGAVEALKRQLSKELTAHLQQFLDKLRKVNSDCVGFGEKYRSLVPHTKLENEKWREAFPKSSIQGRVDIDIIRTGTIE